MRIDIGKEFNYVKDLFVDGCDAPLTAWFEAAKPAALHAALSWYCIDPVEVFTGWARPGGLPKQRRGGTHAKGAHNRSKHKGRWAQFKRGFGFDPNDWLAKKMPFANDMAGRQVTNGVQWMWSGFGQIQRFQNIMFMYTVVEQFFYETALGVARSEYCQQQRASVFLGRSPDQGHFGPAWSTACVINEVLKSRFTSFAGGNGVLPHVDRYRAVFSIESAWLWGGNTEWSEQALRIVRPDGPEVDASIPDGGGPCSVSAHILSAGPVSFLTRGPYSMTVEGVEFNVFGKRREPTVRPEGWCNQLLEDAVNWANTD